MISARQRQSLRGNLERQLATAHRRAAGNVRNADANAEVLSLRQQLDACLALETSRATLRARVRWLEEGETCSAYFFRRFRPRSSSSTLSTLRSSDGSPFSSAAARHAHIQQYFTALCAAPPFFPSDCSRFLDSLTLPTLSAAQNSSLSAPITAPELLSTLKALPPARPLALTASLMNGIRRLPNLSFPFSSPFSIPSCPEALRLLPGLAHSSL